MPEFWVNTIEEIDNAYKILQGTFRTGTTRPLSWRKHQLNQVVLMLHENVEAFVQAFSVDLRKPRFEVLTGEIGPIARRATQSVALLDEWASDESIPVPDWQKSWSPTVLKRPRGVVLIVSPWNYPVALSLLDGYQTMRYTFEEYTHKRSTVDVPLALEPQLSVRYPVYMPATTEALARPGATEAPPAVVESVKARF